MHSLPLKMAFALHFVVTVTHPSVKKCSCQSACCAGDCLVQGYNPPESAVVIQDSVSGENSEQKGSVPLLRPPRGYERVFQDEQSRNEKQLSIWKPVPMPG